MNFDIDAHTIYLARHGSLAYGTNIPTSDIDIKGICIPPLEISLGFLHKFEQHERMANNGHPHDLVIYSLNKFVKLAADCNPNIIEVLFCEEEDVLQINAFGQTLRDKREMFLSTKAKHTFSGYAHSQLKRIKTHRSWTLNPPTKPSRQEFGLTDTRSITKDELGAFQVMKDRNDELDLPKHALDLLQMENKYSQAKRVWDHYQGWLKNRNSSRHQLEVDYGYDTKHGMHLIRLMRMCREILSDEGVKVRRSDANELLEIRAGRVAYDDLIAEAEVIEAECEILYKTTRLRKKPDLEAINDLVVDMSLHYDEMIRGIAHM